MIKEVRLNEGFSEPIALALGFFDSIHIGHKSLIKTAQDAAKCEGCLSALLTFDNNPLELFGRNAPLVYNYDERVKILDELGLDVVLAKTFDKEFMHTSPLDFLNLLVSKYNIRHVVCGRDYTFGSFPQGDAELLRRFFEAKNVKVSVVDDVLSGDSKASSTRVRAALLEGRVSDANDILGSPYRISGLVTRGHSVGSGLGYPTANIFSDKIGSVLRRGVYSVFCCLDGVRYEGVANAGTRPTFDENVFKLETHLINFSGDLYNKEITVYFKSFLRDIKKFDTKEQLAVQIKEDIIDALR